MLQTTMTSLKAKKNSKKGFTLMEMLIVVAIIAILVAIAIPTFTASLTKAKAATDQANYRSAKAVATVAYLDNTYNDGSAASVGGKYFTSDGTWTDKVADAYHAQTASQAGESTPTRTVDQVIKADANGNVAWTTVSAG